MAIPDALATPLYTPQIYSSFCVCTHSASLHHGSVVGDPTYYAQTLESRIAGECLKYGSNESTDSHCPSYWDAANPLPDPYAASRPTPPSLEVRSRLREWRTDHLDPNAPPLISLDQWLIAVQDLTHDGAAVTLDAHRVLRLSLGISDHDNDALDAPYFYAVSLHIDRCLPSFSPTARYDTWWLETAVEDSSVPYPTDDLAEPPLPSSHLTSILAALVTRLYPAVLIPPVDDFDQSVPIY